MKCTHCGSEIKHGAKFCGECGEEVIDQSPEITNTEQVFDAKDGGIATTTVTPKTVKSVASFGWGNRKTIVIGIISLVVLIFVGRAIFGHKSNEQIVYELIPEILEEFDCALGYGDPEYPKFKSDDMIIRDLGYTQNESGDTYDMFYVNGVVTITNVFGNQVPFDYQMYVGLDEEFEKTGKWYAEIIDGDIFW